MAILAPTLAFGRAARSVVRGSTEDEFARWFQPLDFEKTESGRVVTSHRFVFRET